MKWNTDSAGAKWNGDMEKADIERGYEVVPMAGNLAGKVANQRLGLTDQWVKVCDSDVYED